MAGKFRWSLMPIRNREEEAETSFNIFFGIVGKIN